MKTIFTYIVGFSISFIAMVMALVIFVYENDIENNVSEYNVKNKKHSAYIQNVPFTDRVNKNIKSITDNQAKEVMNICYKEYSKFLSISEKNLDEYSKTKELTKKEKDNIIKGIKKRLNINYTHCIIKESQKKGYLIIGKVYNI